jgi:uncharacterized membrane protein YphA (DoxX/SURF4 family)
MKVLKSLMDVNFYNLLRFFLGTVFILAASYRIFCYKCAVVEKESLGIPIYFLFIIVPLEIVIGVCLLLDKKIKSISILAILFLLVSVIVVLLVNFTVMINSLGGIFIFDPNYTDILLHITYIFFFLFLVCKK